MLLGSLLGLGTDLAIDLGTANTCVFVLGRGIVLNEPSVVAYNTAQKRIEAVGTKAREMVGRTPRDLVAVRPMRDGVIADFEAAERMLTEFIRRAHKQSGWLRPRVVVGVPAEITEVERRAVRESTLRARAGEVYLVDEPVAAAIGAGLPITEPFGNMIVDIGGGTTDIAVISLAGLVYRKSVRIGGDEMDEAILDHMKRHHGLLIGERTAERIKIEVGSAMPFEAPRTVEVRGRHLIDGLPKRVIVSDGEIRDALKPTVDVIVGRGPRCAGAHSAGARLGHLRPRRRLDRRRLAAQEPGSPPPRGHRTACANGRGPAYVRRKRRRPDVVEYRPVEEARVLKRNTKGRSGTVPVLCQVRRGCREVRSSYRRQAVSLDVTTMPPDGVNARPTSPAPVTRSSGAPPARR